jgi:hypothetical protein
LVTKGRFSIGTSIKNKGGAQPLSVLQTIPYYFSKLKADCQYFAVKSTGQPAPEKSEAIYDIFREKKLKKQPGCATIKANHPNRSYDYERRD